MNRLIILIVIMTVCVSKAWETKSISIPNEKYAIYDVTPGGSDLVLNILKGPGVDKIEHDGIRLQDGGDMTQWARDAVFSQNAGHPVYTIFSVGVGRESVCVTGVYSVVGSGGGGSGNNSPACFDADVLKMNMIIYVDQPGNGEDLQYKLYLGPPWYDVGHAWYELKITDVEDRIIEDSKLTQIISQSLFGVMNKQMGWYPKEHVWPYYDVPGKFKIPDEHGADVIKTFPVGRVGFGNALAFSKTMKASTNNWVVKTWNCLDVTVTASTAAGLGIPVIRGELPGVLGGGEFSCPGLFGEYLKNNYPNN